MFQKTINDYNDVKINKTINKFHKMLYVVRNTNYIV